MTVAEITQSVIGEKDHEGVSCCGSNIESVRVRGCGVCKPSGCCWYVGGALKL